MENSQNKKIDYKTMQEMLPDYIFNRLTPEENIDFKENLRHYPDLQEEVKQAQAVFSKVEDLHFDNVFGQKTRNLSVKVMNKRDSRRNLVPYPKMSWIYRYGLPIGAILMFLSFFLWDNDSSHTDYDSDRISDYTNIEEKKVDFAHTILSNIDENLIIDSTIDTEVMEDLTAEYSNMEKTVDIGYYSEENTQEMAEIIEDYFYDELIDDLDNSELMETANHPGSYDQLIDELINLSEDEFQNLLEEIDNVKINT